MKSLPPFEGHHRQSRLMPQAKSDSKQRISMPDIINKDNFGKFLARNSGNIEAIMTNGGILSDAITGAKQAFILGYLAGSVGWDGE